MQSRVFAVLPRNKPDTSHNPTELLPSGKTTESTVAGRDRPRLQRVYSDDNHAQHLSSLSILTINIFHPSDEPYSQRNVIPQLTAYCALGVGLA